MDRPVVDAHIDDLAVEHLTSWTIIAVKPIQRIGCGSPQFSIEYKQPRKTGGAVFHNLQFTLVKSAKNAVSDGIDRMLPGSQRRHRFIGWHFSADLLQINIIDHRGVEA